MRSSKPWWHRPYAWALVAVIMIALFLRKMCRVLSPPQT